MRSLDHIEKARLAAAAACNWSAYNDLEQELDEAERAAESLYPKPVFPGDTGPDADPDECSVFWFAHRIYRSTLRPKDKPVVIVTNSGTHERVWSCLWGRLPTEIVVGPDGAHATAERLRQTLEAE